MSTLYLNNIKLQMSLGVHAWEQKVKRTVMVSLELMCDTSKVAKSDQLENTVDYSVIVTCLEEFVQDNRFNLIETLTEKIAELLMDKFQLKQIKVKVTKPRPLPNVEQVAIVVEKSTT